MVLNQEKIEIQMNRNQEMFWSKTKGYSTLQWKHPVVNTGSFDPQFRHPHVVQAYMTLSSVKHKKIF